MIWVEDQHAQAQHWLMHAQAQAQAHHWIVRAQVQAQAQHRIMHAQAQAQLQRKRLAAASTLALNIDIDIQHWRLTLTLNCRSVSSRIHVKPRPYRAVSSLPRLHAWRAVPCQTAACQRVRVLSAPP